jgi:hypothetical protein
MVYSRGKSTISFFLVTIEGQLWYAIAYHWLKEMPATPQRCLRTSPTNACQGVFQLETHCASVSAQSGGDQFVGILRESQQKW